MTPSDNILLFTGNANPQENQDTTLLTICLKFTIKIETLNYFVSSTEKTHFIVLLFYVMKPQE